MYPRSEPSVFVNKKAPSKEQAFLIFSFGPGPSVDLSHRAYLYPAAALPTP